MEDAGDIGQGFTSVAEVGYLKLKKKVQRGGKVGNIDRATKGYIKKTKLKDKPSGIFHRHKGDWYRYIFLGNY